ncbi:nucleoside triphosphate pyrophosphohydrolase [Oleispirillum naphthae]|uniref:nucleoside triphosphate pyrophosphohydrolase n=1 Tax=Oleispirillum naphthae TaxID=2838853 RepID=UPI00308226CF
MPVSVRPASLLHLADIMALLRDPARGCPWDVEQSFATIAPHTVEEAYEVLDAIEDGDMEALKDELGDLLLQVVFHARIAEESGIFVLEDVIAAICDKLVRRHPHVFGEVVVADSRDQIVNWENVKAGERGAEAAAPPSALDGVARALPALLRAAKLQKRAARVGFDWAEARQVLAKIREEIGEVEAEIDAAAPQDRLEDEIGDVLFAVANLARKLDIDPEGALRHTNEKFARRFRFIEQALERQGKSPAQSSLDEMETLWQKAKSEDLAETPR